MAVYRTYQCPSCHKPFDFLHHPNDEPPPSFCPLCGASTTGEKKRRKPRQVSRALSPEKVQPMTRRIASKSVDGLYRQMETSAENRMQDAAEMLGCDVASLKAMKMTNMKDSLREGDMSMSHDPTPATQITGAPVDANGNVIGPNGPKIGQVSYQDRSQGAEYAKSVGQGPYAFAGNKMREMISSSHDRRAASVSMAGRMNKKG